ncbi:MAG: hypothetical protein Q8N99_00655 [Nanoarchaeota archaeon]|nr:hypothetical protein [Nanoarchaeota archaeon]
MKKIILTVVLILGITMILSFVSAIDLTNDEIRSNIALLISSKLNSGVDSPKYDKNYDLNDDNYIKTSDVLMVLGIRNLSNEEFSRVHSKIMNASMSCLNKQLGDEGYISQFDVNNDTYIKTSDILRISSALSEGRESISCTDSDGLNYYNKGSVKDATGERFDYCKDGDEGVQYVTEYFCSGSGINSYEAYKCPNGCNDGACNKVTNNTVQCTDSDGGINYYLNGTTHYGKFDYTDWCVISDSVVNQGQSNEYTLKRGDLIEYACNGEDGQPRCTDTACKFIKYHCENGCSNGACLKEGCKKVCKNIGTKSEGWYNSCTEELLEYALCGSSLCSDSDNGLNYYEKGTTKWKVEDGSTNSEDDYCTDKTVLSEGVCGKTDENGKSYRRESHTCPNGCNDGACIKGDPISEKITCKFEYTKKEQQCYLAGQWGPEDEGTKFCKAGSGSCVITYSGYNGEQVTWKSTCGQYQYTTQDGNDEVIYFKCNEGKTTISEIINKGFRFAYWECYNGKEWKSEGKNCLSAELWKKKAINFCNSECKKEKCGVNSFSLGEACYSEDETTICSLGDDIQDCCSNWAKKNNQIIPACMGGWNIENDKCIFSCKEETEIPIEALICKDSCPLDNKCYPFGYRKSGKYCTDSGGFEPQLKADKTCENNFECSSNVCVSGKCISEGFIQKILNWFRKLFGD